MHRMYLRATLITVSQDGAQVPHSACWHPDCCFLAHSLCSQLLEPQDSGILSIDVVPDLGLWDEIAQDVTGISIKTFRFFISDRQEWPGTKH